MFKYACISCGEKLGEGIPPIEALTATQRGIVGSTMRWGLRRDGKSNFQFCSFCLLFEEVYETMDKKEPEEPYRFSDYGRAIWVDYPDAVFAYYCPIFANRMLMMHNVVSNIDNLQVDLAFMLLDQMEEVKTKQIETMEREAAREEYEKTLRFKIRRAYFRTKQKLSLPYHVKQGLLILWMALTMDVSTEEAEMGIFDFLSYNQDWEYENDRNAPFARFELWALDVLDRRFGRLVNKKR